MHAVFVHGWGYHAGLWEDVIALCPELSVSRADLGFVAGGPAGVETWPEDSIAIGHSLGLLWLLQQERRFRALVSVQGFDCFCCHVPTGRVEAMRRGLKQNAAATLGNFWRSCGTPDFANPEDLNVDKLDEGLDWLMNWNATGKAAALDCPVLALAARDDPIVPATMSASIWGEKNVTWSDEGGHALPLRRPEWCADRIKEFARGLA
jgi:pimeloyl-[acyl-carrier protein] methyl ester esterase